MEGEVAAPAGMEDGVMVLVAVISRIDRLHGAVEAEDEIAEVEAQAEAVGDGDLLEEGVEQKLAAGLLGIGSERPDVARIDKGGAVKLPEQVGAILEVEVEAHVAGLIDEVDAAVAATILAGTELADAPAAHGVGTTGEVALLEGQHGAVAIGPRHTQEAVEGQRVVGAETQQARVFEVELGILGVGDIEELALAVAVLLEAEDLGEAAQQVARRLDARTDDAVAGVVGEAEARLHDEEVLVVVAQDGVAVGDAVEVVVLEGGADPGHIDVAEVEDVELVLHPAVARRPPILEAGGEDTAMELGPVLEIPGHGELGRGRAAATALTREEGSHQAGHLETGLDAILLVVAALVALQSLDGLEGATELDAEEFATAEEVAVLIGQRGGCSEVASRIGALGLEGDGVGLAHGEADVGVEVVEGVLAKGDVGVADGAEPREVVVGALQVGGAKPLAGLDHRVFGQHAAAQGQIVAVAGSVVDGSHAIAGMGHGGRAAVLAVGQDAADEVDALRALEGVGGIGDEVFVETVEAGVVEDGGDALAEVIEGGDGEDLAHLLIARAKDGGKDLGHGGVGDVVAEGTDAVGIAGMEGIDGLELAATDLRLEIDVTVHIAHVLHGQAQVGAGPGSLEGVIDDGLLADMAQRAVEPLRGVAARQGVGAQGNLEEGEPMGVALLADVLAKLGGVEVLAVGAHLDGIEEVAVFGHELGRGATRQGRGYQRDQQQ